MEGGGVGVFFLCLRVLGWVVDRFFVGLSINGYPVYFLFCLVSFCLLVCIVFCVFRVVLFVSVCCVSIVSFLFALVVSFI